MEKALPNYDTERVYLSDIKKLSQWYNILHKAGYITPDSFVKAEGEVASEEPATEEKAEKKPAAKKAAPKTEKPAAPKAKASSGAKSTVKTTQRKQG